MAHAKDNAASGLHSVNALRTAQGSRPMTADEVNDEDIADVIANLLHLAAEQEMDPAEVWDKGWHYFEGDDEEDEITRPAPNVEAFHGTPADLPVGTTLRPGVHLHFVHASRTFDEAEMWGRKKAGQVAETHEDPQDVPPYHVYRVRMSQDTVEGTNGFYGTSAVVLEEVPCGR